MSPSGEDDDRTIIAPRWPTLDRLGTDWWCGYSFAWLGNLKARALDGEGAAAALRTVRRLFLSSQQLPCQRRSDRRRASRKFTYRPFTLEGNFAFAAGIQEMLLQSHTGMIRVFPAVPAAWKDAAFSSLRAQGAFLVSARRVDGAV